MTEATETQATEQRQTEEPKPVTTKVEQNGITKPKEGTKTGQVWSISDAISAKLGEPAPRKEVLDACEKAGINPATAATQYGKWRVFHGLVGERAPKATPVEKPAKEPKATKAKAKKGEEVSATPEAPAAPAPAAPKAPAAPSAAVVEDDEV